MNDKETEIISGTLDSIAASTNKKGEPQWKIMVTPTGLEHAKGIWTKNPGMRDALTPSIGQHVTVLCNVSHWTNQEGKAVRSLWAESIGNGAGPVQQAVQAVRESKAVVANAPDPTRQSIERQVSLKCAVDFHVGIAQTTEPSEVIHTAALFFAYLQNDPSWLDKQIKAQLDEQVPF